MPVESSPDSLSVIAAQVVANDPELRDRVRKIVSGILSDTEYVLKYGTAAERTALSRSMTPGLIRALQSAESSGKAAEQAQVHDRLRKQLAAGLNIKKSDTGE